ncbi:MAG: VPLPA-CTERM sorting domain-containing protein [Geobacteraceae bacterium]|nr:VPLPA-CTERM sorting domain-containing protein [Geobacteraceae bacterium]
MKIHRLALISALLVLSFASLADAALVDPVQFWVYDEPGLPGDGRITLSVSNFDFSGSTVSATLQYSMDNNTNWTSAAPVITLAGEQHQLYFRLIPDSAPAITSGDLNFQGQDGSYYNGATINWSDYADITIGVAGNKDKLSAMNTTGSPVPLPAPFLLLGSGFAGLGFLRRKFLA